jgi:hypothetical protein
LNFFTEEITGEGIISGVINVVKVGHFNNFNSAKQMTNFSDGKWKVSLVVLHILMPTFHAA